MFERDNETTKSEVRRSPVGKVREHFNYKDQMQLTIMNENMLIVVFFLDIKPQAPEILSVVR